MTEKFQNKYRIPSARATWHGYDDGIYFVTICTSGREHYFGEIENGQMNLSVIGQTANNCWREIPQHFPHVEIPIWVVMPNHIHGIVKINGQHDPDCCSDAKLCVSTTNKFGPQSKNLASVIRGFKIGVTKFANENNIPFAWQPRFHDHIVRNQDELNNISTYIENNVAKWQSDKFYK